MESIYHKIKTYKLNFIKIKNFFQRTPLRKWKKLSGLENFLQIMYLIRALYLEYIKGYDTQQWKDRQPNLKIGKGSE